MCAARRNRDTGRWENVYISGRSDMALVRSLRDGNRRQVAVRTLILHQDEGLRRDPATYPDLPKGSLRRLQVRQGPLDPAIAPRKTLSCATP